jgi:DNA-binding NarL/FixJ family response regulator
VISKNISVVLVDDHLVFREGLRSLLESHSDIQVVGEAGTGRQAVGLARKLRPDVVVMDIAMPSLNGIEATRQILAFLPSAKILALSAHSDDEYVVRAVSAGVSGYLLKQTSAQVLVAAIREVNRGGAAFSASVARRLRTTSRFAEHSFKRTGGNRSLTSRENEVIQLVAEGKPNKQMADDLKISIKTVEKHRQNLMDKLNIHDTAGLTRYAIAEGIIESGVRFDGAGGG